MNPIRKALKTLPGHWHQGSMSDNLGNFCGMGHVHKALGDALTPQDLDLYWDAYNAMSEAAKDKFPERAAVNNGIGHAGFAFPKFNDDKETTEADVQAVMELAADRWDVEREG